MIKRRRFPKIFFGWWTVVGGGFLALWGFGFHIWGFSALFKPLAAELGLTRAMTSVPAAVARLEGGFEAPVSGWLSDRFGPRVVILLGIFVIGLGLLLMYFINSFWSYFVVWAIIVATGSNFALTIPIEKAVTDWFVKKRGLAIGIRWVFTGSAGVLMTPLVAWLIITEGWRMACVTGGLVMLVVGLLLSWFCFKPHRPEYYGLLPDGAETEEEVAEARQMIERGVEYAAEIEEVEFTLRQAMRTPAYWLIAVSTAFDGMVVGTIIFHSIPLLTDMGLDSVRAAALTGVLVIAMLPAMFSGGFFADRIKRGNLRFLMGGAMFMEATGITLFLLNPSIPMFCAWYALHYLGVGLGATIRSIMQGRYFGRKAFGSIRGITMLVTAPFGMLAPVYTGWIFDTTGSYTTAFIVFAVVLAVGATAILFAFPPKPPARITDVDKFV